ncbi:MAG: transglutaminase-like domain-containing protein [Propionivibrio sp.]
MKRRDFLSATAILSLLGAAPALAQTKKAQEKAKKPKPKPKTNKKPAAAASETDSTGAHSEPRNAVSLPDEPAPNWRGHDVRSTLTLAPTRGPTRLWLPLVQYRDTPWARSLGHRWQGNFSQAGIYRDPVADMEVFYAEWPNGGEEMRLELTSQIATQDRHFDITRRNNVAERTEVLRRCLQPTEQMPTDGIVHRTAERAIGRVKDPLAMAKAVYEWVIDNTSYDPQAAGIGNQNIGQMLDSGRLAGRSADISLLFVALCRSLGIPARPVFGLRLDSSRLFGSLGVTGDLSQAQHCRAEFYVPGYSWVAVNPSDVRKAIHDEQLSLQDPKLNVLKKLLFGFWEMNWIGYNAAQDVNLRGLNGAPLPYLAAPKLETPEGLFDPSSGTRLSYAVRAERSAV